MTTGTLNKILGNPPGVKGAKSKWSSPTNEVKKKIEDYYMKSGQNKRRTALKF